MTSRQRVRCVWLPALVVAWALLAHARCSTPPPYRGPVHVLPAGTNARLVG